ncbi:MAG: O-antigen ligase family protein [Candidatus Limnocylindria bacterium]
MVGGAAALGEWEASLALALAAPLAVVVLHYPWAAVMVWIAAMPFLVVDDSASVSPGVWALHRLLIASTLAIVLLYRVLGLSRSRFRLGMPDLFVTAFIVLGVVNVILLSGNPSRMIAAFFDHLIVPMAIYWLVRLSDPGEAEMRRLFPIVVVVVVIQVAIGMMSWLAPGALPAAWLGRAGERTIGSLGTPGAYTVTLVFGGLLSIHAARGTRSPLIRWILVLIAVATVVGVALSLSRGSWLGAAVAFGGLLFVFPRTVIPAAAASLLVGAVLAFGPFSGTFAGVDQRIGDDATAESRLITNNAAVRMIATQPALGFGYGNFERYDEQFKERLGDIPVQPGSAHNVYLALGAENGAPALVLYLLPVGWLLIRSAQLWRYMPTGRWVNRALLVVLWLAIADQFIVSNFMDMLHSSTWGTGLWWICLGLVHVVIARASARRAHFHQLGTMSEVGS